MLALCLVWCPRSKADSADPETQDSVRLYSTRYEQREAGIEHALTP